MMSSRAGTRRCRQILSVIVFAAVIFAPGIAAEESEEGPNFSRKGADTCIGCHDDEAVLAIFKTPHGHPDDPNAPFSQAQCESCHRAGGAHSARVRRGEERAPIDNFGARATTRIADQNAVCMDCHQSDIGLDWHGSMHDLEFVACAQCHQVHAPRDRVMLRYEQAEVCYPCHQQQRAASFKASVHPLRQGKISCSSCHDAHGSVTDHLLVRETVNQLCYDCHAEKRGPFLWEHAPVPEDCSLCHNPHGSNNPALLTRRPPLLCQQCHSQAGHPSIPFTDQSLPPNNPSAFVVGGSCMNCHSRIHGSNHPSGVDLSR